MTEAQITLQARIDAEQTYDTIVYGLKAIQAAGGENRLGNGPLFEQAVAARREASSVLGREIDWRALGWEFRKAKKIAAENLKAAKAEIKAIGGKRQLRLALAA